MVFSSEVTTASPSESMHKVGTCTFLMRQAEKVLVVGIIGEYLSKGPLQAMPLAALLLLYGVM